MCCGVIMLKTKLPFVLYIELAQKHCEAGMYHLCFILLTLESSEIG